MFLLIAKKKALQNRVGGNEDIEDDRENEDGNEDEEDNENDDGDEDENDNKFD